MSSDVGYTDDTELCEFCGMPIDTVVREYFRHRRKIREEQPVKQDIYDSAPG